MAYAAAKQPLAPATDPWAQFQCLFTKVDVDKLNERQSALAIARAELQRIQPRIARAELPKIEAHLNALANLERRLMTRSDACKGPTLSGGLNASDNANTPAVVDSQLALIAAALSCDLTRVASFQYSIGDNDGGAYPWLGISDGHHGLTHAADSDSASWEKVTRIRVWYAEKFAQLLDLLDAVPEGNGSLLDNCMVVWGSELGTGNTHSFKSVPFVVAGGGGGAYRTGRFLEYNESLTHNRLLVSICRAFGFDDVNTFGDTDLGSGPLPGF